MVATLDTETYEETHAKEKAGTYSPTFMCSTKKELSLMWILLALVLNAMQTEIVAVPLDVFTTRAECEAQYAVAHKHIEEHVIKTNESVRILCVELEPTKKKVI